MNSVHPHKSSKTDRVMQKPREIIADIIAPETDPNGSYTGAPLNRNETPVQDADDL
jgi:hypothetical protein